LASGATVLAIDPVSADLLVGGYIAEGGFLIFGPGQSGNVAPQSHLNSSVFTSAVPNIATDPANGNLWVVQNYCIGPVLKGHGLKPTSGSICYGYPANIYEFNEGDHGTVAPDKTITPGVGSFENWSAVAVGTGGHLWVATNGGYGSPQQALMKFNTSDSGTTTPLRYIHGSNVPSGDFVSLAIGDGGYVFVSDQGHNKIWIWNGTDTGNVAPDGYIACSCFSGSLGGLAFDSSDHLYVADVVNSDVYEFNGSDRGTVSPIDTVTLEDEPNDVALCYGPTSISQCVGSGSFIKKQQNR
jgi:hypothetical protein